MASLSTDAFPSSSPSGDDTKEAAPQNGEYEALLSQPGTLTTKGICAAYERRIKAYQAAATNRVASAKGKSSDPYVAAAYRRTHNWVRDPIAKRFSKSMEDAAVAALNIVTDGKAGQSGPVAPYLTASIDVCGLTSAYAKAVKGVDASLAAGARIRSAADRKPWYPKGYEEWVDGVAFKYNRGATSAGYLGGWAYNVVSRDGCPVQLYIEVNFTDGGTVVDYGNDLLSSLDPGQRALIQLRTTADGVDQFEINEVTCL